MKQKISKLIKWALSFIPTALPQTEADHAKWSTEVLEVAGLPDNTSFRIAISSMVLHLDSGTARASKQGFIRQLKRSIANQCAYNIMTDLKQLEKAADEQRAKEASSQVVQETST